MIPLKQESSYSKHCKKKKKKKKRRAESYVEEMLKS